MADFATPAMSVIQTVKVYNRRKAVGTSWLVLDAPNDRVVIMEKCYDPDTDAIGECQVGTITRADILAAKDEIAAARLLINNFVTEVQAL